MRLGWEFNVPQGYAWYAGGYAPQFVRFWRDVVTVMRAVPGADFTFDWNPNIGSTLSDLQFPSTSNPAATAALVRDF